MLSTPQGEGLNGAVRGPPGRGRKYVRGSKIHALALAEQGLGVRRAPGGGLLLMEGTH